MRPRALVLALLRAAVAAPVAEARDCPATTSAGASNGACDSVIA